MNDEQVRRLSDVVAEAVLKIEPDFATSQKELSDYFFVHPSEMKEAIEDHRIDITEI